MVTLDIFLPTLLAYRHSFLVDEQAWITTRTPLYAYDLAVPNETLFKIQFKILFPNRRAEVGQLGTLEVSKEQQRFYLDDTSVGCEGRKYSNLFYRYAMATDRKVDRIGMEHFHEFWVNYDPPLTSGERAVRFLNLIKLVGYKQWRRRVMPPDPEDDMPYCELYVDRMFPLVYPSLLQGVYEARSKHPLIVTELWDLFCLSDRTRLMLFTDVPDVKHLKFMLEVANMIKFDFWGIKYGGNGLTEHILVNYIEKERLDLITLMLDYGFVIGEMDDENMDYVDGDPLTHAFSDYTCKVFVHNDTLIRFLVRCYEHCRVFELPGFVEVFQKVSRTLPFPSVPPSYVRMHLQAALSQRVVIEEMTAIYEQCHPYDSSEVSPQTLSHLSRCVLRDRLARNHQQLPTAIDDSHLTTLIKRFLKLEF